MSEQNPSAPAPCAEFREEIPLLAVGSMDPARTEVLEKHLADCAACKASYKAHCQVLEAVKRVGPKRVITIHGFTKEFAAELRRQNYEAWSVDGGDQMELDLQR